MFKDKLRNTRENRELSQTEMAQKLGIAVTTYRNYENTTREPNYEILVNIANLLDVSVDYLLGNENKGNSLNLLLLKSSKLTERSFRELNLYLDYLIYKDKNNIQ
mgnify:FL=1